MGNKCTMCRSQSLNHINKQNKVFRLIDYLSLNSFIDQTLTVKKMYQSDDIFESEEC